MKSKFVRGVLAVVLCVFSVISYADVEMRQHQCPFSPWDYTCPTWVEVPDTPVRKEIPYRKRVEKLANGGDSEAQADLGYYYWYGKEGFPRNDVLAVKWFLRAANNGKSVAYGYLVYDYLYAAYFHGRGVRKNEIEAKKWLKKAADAGLARAQRVVAANYFDQDNYPLAIQYYQKAIDQGDTLAMVGLGNMYVNGTGLQQNDTEAIRLYRMAANKGDPLGQFNLGTMYFLGRGVRMDRVIAYGWTVQAVHNGASQSEDYRNIRNWYRNALRDRDMVYNTLTPAQQEEARRTYAKWLR